MIRYKSLVMWLFIFIALTWGSFAYENITYGEMYNRTGALTPFLFSIPLDNVYYNVTFMEQGNLNGFNFTQATQANGGSYLTATRNGTYRIDATISFSVAVAGGLYAFVIGRNFDSTNYDCYTRREVSAIVGNIGITCIMPLVRGDIINVMVEDEVAPARDISLHNMNLNIIEIESSYSSSTSGSGSSSSGGVNMSVYFLILFFVAIMIVYGAWRKNYVMEIFSGIIFMLMGIIILTGEFSTVLPTAFNIDIGVGIIFSLIGFYFIYLGVMEHLSNRNIGRD